MKICSKCGTKIENDSKYCTGCGVLVADTSKFTYKNKSMNNPTYYMGSGATTKNENYAKLVKNINASFAIGVGVVVAFVVLLIAISF